jgi:hypothetical protein
MKIADHMECASLRASKLASDFAAMRWYATKAAASSAPYSEMDVIDFCSCRTPKLHASPGAPRARAGTIVRIWSGVPGGRLTPEAIVTSTVPMGLAGRAQDMIPALKCRASVLLGRTTLIYSQPVGEL